MLQAKLRSNVLAHLFTMARFSHSVFSLKVSSSGTTASSPDELISHTSPRSPFSILHEMNQTSHCSTRDCSGILLALRKLTGLQARLSRGSFTRDRLPKTTTVNGTPSFSAASQIPRSMWTIFSRETREKTKNLLLLNWNFFSSTPLFVSLSLVCTASNCDKLSKSWEPATRCVSYSSSSS